MITPAYTPYTELAPRETGWVAYPDAYAIELSKES